MPRTLPSTIVVGRRGAERVTLARVAALEAALQRIAGAVTAALEGSRMPAKLRAELRAVVAEAEEALR